MTDRRGFTLVELMVSIAILAVLAAVLLPAFGHASAQARQAVCAGNLAEMARALHMYAVDYGGQAMPLAYDRVRPVTYWWGADTPSGVDYTRGFVWPYLRSELRPGSVYECPEQPWGTYRLQGEGGCLTSTYGYNGYYLSPRYTPGWWRQIGHRPWQNLDTLKHPQRVFAFADTLIALDDEEPRNVALLDPPYLYHGRGRWRLNRDPTTSFRHRRLTNAAHVDGHVDSHGTHGGRITSHEFQIGSVGADNDPHYVPDWRAW